MKREIIGSPVRYSGRVITAHPMAPDVLIRKDDQDFGLFLSIESGVVAAMKSIDAEDKDKRESEKKAAGGNA